MIPITSPFAVWWLDMVIPFKRSTGKKTHLLVAVDKFTKWVEAEPVSKCDTATTVKFLKKLIFRFVIPTASSQIMEQIFLRERCRNFVS